MSPTTVTAVGARYLHKSIADVTTTHLSFPGGERAHVFVSWLHPFKEQKLVVVGDRGMAVFDDGEPWDTKLDGLPRTASTGTTACPQPVEGRVRTGSTRAGRTIARSSANTSSTASSRARHLARTAPKVCGCCGCSPQAGRRPRRRDDSARATTARLPDIEGVFVHETRVHRRRLRRSGHGTRVWHFSHLLVAHDDRRRLHHRPERHDRAQRAGRRSLQDPEQRERLRRRHARGRRLLRTELCVHQRADTSGRRRAEGRVPADACRTRRRRSGRTPRSCAATRSARTRWWPPARSSPRDVACARARGRGAGPPDRLGQPRR